MDSLDLLAREDEFKKLNKQLEKKTESLMKEIEHVMQKQDFFSEFSHKLTLSPTHLYTKKHCCNTPNLSTPEKTPTKSKTVTKQKTVNSLIQQSGKENKGHIENPNSEVESQSNSGNVARIVCECCTVSRERRLSGDLEFLYAFVSVSVQEKILPQAFLKDRATVESVCKFLSSKVKLMQEQIEKLQNTINKKASQCEVHLTQQAELESERMALLNQTNNLRATSAETRAKCMALQKKLEEKDRLYKEQRSETDKLTSEVKHLRSRNASVEARCATQEEAISSLKHQLETAKRAEKDFRDSTRSLSASHTSAISRLEARVKTLTTRMEKQSALIQNLRRQAALLATEGAVRALEKEYCDFLTKVF